MYKISNNNNHSNFIPYRLFGKYDITPGTDITPPNPVNYFNPLNHVQEKFLQL